jgi:DNA-binding CsgD family transcriptional regulator
MAAEYGETLSERELEITELVAEGLTNREVADRLYLSHNTVKVHLRNIFTKTGVASRTELSMLAVQEGWITIPGVKEDIETDADKADHSPEDVEDAEDAQVAGVRRLDWPWQRWATLGFGLVLMLIILLLPQRRSTPGSAQGPGEVFGASGTAPHSAAAASEDGWEELTPLPVRRAGMGVTVFEGKAYVIGGMTDTGTTGRVDVYDFITREWTQGPDRPIAVVNANVATLADRIWAAGGCDAAWRPTRTLHSFDPGDAQWSEANPLPDPLCAYTITAYKERLFVFGGWDGERYRNLALAYTPADDTWEKLAPPQQARGYGAAAVLEDRIFYVGGYDGEREWATCEVYFPAVDTWESCNSMLQPRGGLSLVATGGRLYAIGGGWQTPLGFNERYTPASDLWSVLETPIVGEWRNLGAVPWDTAIYAIGGWSGTDFLNRTYAIEVMPWRVFIPGTFRSP